MMAFDKDYPNRKDWRKQYRGAKAVDSQCRNHGECAYCREGRQHANKRRMPVMTYEDDLGPMPLLEEIRG